MEKVWYKHRAVENSKNPIFTELCGRLICEKGYTLVGDSYIVKEREAILNRSRGAESNFFVIAEDLGHKVSLLFTNPRDDAISLGLQKKEIIVRLEISSKVQIGGVIDKIVEFSRGKGENVYYCNLHSHLGYVNGEALWGDGITKDRNWIRQSILWNYDIHALTEHNWTQNEERLGFLNNKCANAGIVFVPGWENTTTVVDNIMSPHILVWCADIETAMRAKYEFLSKKLENKNKAGVTPILCGAPGPFDAHIEYITKLRAEKKVAAAIAHPFSTLPGIDLFDPAIVFALGKEKVWSILQWADGVEMYNGGEGHCELDFDLADGKRDFRSDIADDLRKQLAERGLNPFLSPPMLNYLVGLWARANLKWTLYGHDDHYVPDINCNGVGIYGHGHTRYVISEATLQKLKSEERKPTAAEFVASVIDKTFPGTDEEIELEAFAYAKMTPKGPQIVGARRKSFFEKIVEKARALPEYYCRIAHLQLKYIFADKVQRDEIAKELEKAGAWNSRPELPSRPPI